MVFVLVWLTGRDLGPLPCSRRVKNAEACGRRHWLMRRGSWTTATTTITRIAVVNETPRQACRHPLLRPEEAQRHAHAGRIENSERITSTATGHTNHVNEHLIRTAWFVRNKHDPPCPKQHPAATEGFLAERNRKSSVGGTHGMPSRGSFYTPVFGVDDQQVPSLTRQFIVALALPKKRYWRNIYDVRGLRSQRATQGLARASEGTLDGIWRYT